MRVKKIAFCCCCSQFPTAVAVSPWCTVLVCMWWGWRAEKRTFQLCISLCFWARSNQNEWQVCPSGWVVVRVFSRSGGDPCHPSFVCSQHRALGATTTATRAHVVCSNSSNSGTAASVTTKTTNSNTTCFPSPLAALAQWKTKASAHPCR